MRYWVLFWIAAGLAVHAFVVGRQLESSFFMMMFFWGFVAISALRGSLQIAQSMAVIMVIVLSGLTLAPYVAASQPHSLAYGTFALYPALVSWVSVFFYIRYLRRRDGDFNRSPLLR